MVNSRVADGMTIDAPLRLDHADSIAWDAACDVLVLGFGAAGACAAIEAASHGASVILCDRFQGGGASAKSGGVVYAGGGTKQQQLAGVNDTPQAMYDYLRQETGDVVSTETLRSFCENSAAMIDWLSRHGVEFDSAMPPVKTSYPADGYYLYYSGNEAVPRYARLAAPAPRGHRTKGSGMSGAALMSALRHAVLSAGVQVWTQSCARRLVVDVGGKVIGVEVGKIKGIFAALHRLGAGLAERLHNAAPGAADLLRRGVAALESRHAMPAYVRANKRVVLATGGFIFNRAMLAHHAPRYLRAWRLGTTGCDGSGIRLGQAAGGDCAQMHNVSAWRFINPPLPWARSIVVNAAGQRICNEEVYGALLGHVMCEKADGRAWLILDARLRQEALSQCFKGGLWFFQSGPALMLMLFGAIKARDADTLAQRIGMPAQGLRATLDAYNAAARGEIGDAFDKSPAMMAEINHGPLYAIDISMDSKIFPCPVITLGGLRVDEKTGAVLQADGSGIAGLYAAGRAALGVASNHYVSGLSLADCVWSGRRAGRLMEMSSTESTPYINNHLQEKTYGTS
ncbi:FAD-binding protein [Herbaspirillum sp. GCM10030257]|uniref:FAD-binding protein n=1 Tax=Herbaspirillum sp. GCM10030257 TaxID=3273393 RepID=UPI003613162C